MHATVCSFFVAHREARFSSIALNLDWTELGQYTGLIPLLESDSQTYNYTHHRWRMAKSEHPRQQLVLKEFFDIISFLLCK